VGGLKVAITAWHTTQARDAQSLLQQGQRAEALGFHSYWLPENHFGDQSSTPSPLTLLAAVAAGTERLKLGTTSYLLPIRHPIQAAEETAVLDQISGGRLILGLGRGIQDDLFDAYDIDRRDKRTLFENNLEIMRRAWRGESLSTGRDDKPIMLAPLPMQRPHPPLWVAALGQLALKQAGKLGLPYLASPIEPLDKLADNYRCHAEAARQAGHDPVNIVPVMRNVFISARPSLVERVRQGTANMLPPAMRSKDVEVTDWAVIGDRHYVQDKLSQYVEELRISHLIGGGRLPPINDKELLASHEQLAGLSAAIGNR